MALTEGQLTALRNLARKQAGEDVDWINIADARALTELGFAERNRGGWEITSAGLAAAKADNGSEKPETHSDDGISPFRR